MKPQITIGSRIISRDHPCFIIGEAGVNHNGDLDLALKLVDSAKKAGADAVKFQAFKADDVVSPEAYLVEYQQKNLNKSPKSQAEMLRQYELSMKEMEELKKHCDRVGILFLATPHSWEAADEIEHFVPAYKIGSGDLTNLPFLEHVAKKGKPMIIGTGMSYLKEVKEALATIERTGNDEVVVLHCTTSYPCPIEDVNLKAMPTMQKELECLVGYSDHTLGMLVPIVAVSLRATVLEKHLTLDRNLPGPDHKASLVPEEFKSMVSLVRECEKALGNPIKGPTNSEKSSLHLIRKSIHSKVALPSGTKISRENVSIKRPGNGISPGKLNKIIGMRLKKPLKKDEQIELKDLY